MHPPGARTAASAANRSDASIARIAAVLVGGRMRLLRSLSRGLPPHFDWVASGTGFTRGRFESVWRDVAAFVGAAGRR